ncbi:DUF1385 domain-containing protein [Candidatus Woesearchaeota archaeon]|nr:DUF1385 domain-containing protein [Candidatus Woesearchaeota archaeon]
MDFIGGQAVIEGVLMKNGSKVAIAVRDPKGKITVKKETFNSLTKKYKVLNLPFIRGIIILFETMILGIKALNYSTEISLEEKEKTEKKESTKLSSLSIFFTIILSIALALFLFKFVPLFLAQTITGISDQFNNRFLFNIIEGIIKISILIIYISLISLMPDIKRVFEYHGAEHKVVNAYEHNDLENAKAYSRIHLRCGTSFIIFVLMLSIVVYMFIPMDFSLAMKYIVRILLLPLIAGIGYELIKLSPKYEKNFLFKILIYPGVAVQKLTTREPDDKQIEVAKKALTSVL